MKKVTRNDNCNARDPYLELDMISDEHLDGGTVVSDRHSILLRAPSPHWCAVAASNVVKLIFPVHLFDVQLRIEASEEIDERLTQALAL